jgi:2-polyprenyl-6-methoxyphenol hydroxylase-like FAD-dependent oxidoreductase
MATRPSSTQCCIAGGGPAGIMLGFLLARAGVDVVVLEKHADFLRDFRGDTIHPSTLTILDDLGLLEAFLELPHDEIQELTADVYGEIFTMADFRHVPAARQMLVLVPQWDFLDFIADRARRLPNFQLLMGTKAEGVVTQGERVTGLEARDADGNWRISADLVVAADGRHTTVRESAGLAVTDVGAPIDVLWFRLQRDAARHPSRTGGIIRAGAMLVTLNRNSYWQCAFVIPKGSLEGLQAEGLERFRARIAAIAPYLEPELQELASWDAIKLLSVQITDLPRWYREGLLCIGDAAHAMSPVGGVGINLAIQDAVAAANRLAAPLRERRVSQADLDAIQRRRTYPMKLIQGMQVFIQDQVLSRIIGRETETRPPLPFRLLDAVPYLRRFPAWFIGVGPRPEHVDSSLLAPSGGRLA